MTARRESVSGRCRAAAARRRLKPNTRSSMRACRRHVSAHVDRLAVTDHSAATTRVTRPAAASVRGEMRKHHRPRPSPTSRAAIPHELKTAMTVLTGKRAGTTAGTSGRHAAGIANVATEAPLTRIKARGKAARPSASAITCQHSCAGRCGCDHAVAATVRFRSDIAKIPARMAKFSRLNASPVAKAG